MPSPLEGEGGLVGSPFYGPKIVLITDQASAVSSSLIEILARHGLRMASQFMLPDKEATFEQRKEVISQAIASVRGSNVQEIIVAVDLGRWPELRGLISELRSVPLPVSFVPVGPTSELLKMPAHTIGQNITFELQSGPRTLFQLATKRVFDIVLALTALVLLSPLLILVAIAIKMDSPGPILFQQRRCGFNGRQFQILKFRTMSVMEDGESIVQATYDDHRVTRVGKWLRSTSIDELPQLINVLQGDMSIIGPRPHAVAHDNQFDKLVRNYAMRHHVKPGLSGWAQVHGFRGQTPAIADMEERVKLDLWYIDNWSLGLDLKIIFLTVIELTRGSNAY